MANLKFLRYKTTSEFNAAKTNKSFKQGDIVFDSGAKILYIVTDDTPTLEPYYGNNAIKDVSCSGATITVTLSDGSTKSIDVNNVVSAGTATNATNDSDGNKINTTYFKKSGGTIDGATTINGGLTATGETDVESLTADSLIVNGSTRFNNNVTADTFTGNLKGNADTATSASTAGTASKLSTNAGSATLPVYFDEGVPKPINTTDVGISITGSAASATKATQDASGNTITETYATKNELANKSDSTHNHDDSYLLKQRMTSPNTNSPGVGITPFNVLAYKSAGTPLFTDPEFETDTNSVYVYNNSANGTVTLTRGLASDFGIENSGNHSKYVLKFVHSGEASPGIGGFYAPVYSNPNKVFVEIFRAMVPVGYSFEPQANSFGDGGSHEFITDPNGTGKWEWYAIMISCGKTGTFSSVGHVNLKGDTPSTDNPITWYMSYFNVIDITASDYDGLRTKYADEATTASSALKASVAEMSNDTVLKKYASKTTGQYYGLMIDELYPNKIAENANPVGSVVFGLNNTINSQYSLVSGGNNVVNGACNAVFGNTCTASGVYGIVNGLGNYLYNEYSIANGSNVAATGKSSVALGYSRCSPIRLLGNAGDTTYEVTSGFDSDIVFVGNCITNSSFSDFWLITSVDTTNHTITLDKTISSVKDVTGRYMLYTSGAYGDFSCSIGYDTMAKSTWSLAFGYGITTNNTYEVAFGHYNKSNSTTLFSFGNGTSSSRSNAFELTTSGDGIFAGSVAATSFEGPAAKVKNALTAGDKSYDGSAAVEITAADLGLSSALKFLGTTTTVLTDGATTDPITINGANVTAQIGNVVLYNHLEFIWNGSSWEELGDENSFALKSIQIKVGDGLSGGGALDGNVTISHKDTSSQASMTTGGRTYINSITLDDYGHVTALGTGTETDQTTVSSIPWTGITGKPTTLSGYGITDGVPTYTVNVAQTDLTWIKAIAAKKANRMSFYYNHNGSEWSYLLGCRNIDADDSLTYGSILKFGYTDTYLRILRITSGSWKSTDWEKISAGYADTSGSCSGNAATATSATTSKAITINTDAYSNTADSCMPTGADTFAVYRTGANSGITGADGNIIAMTWSNDEGKYGSQIYVDCDPTGYMAFRQRNGSGTWTDWRNIIHSGNIASQSVKYATSAGTATSCSGNSATTTKLATAVNINGTSFNGASSITTANWGTARNITITDGTNTGAAVSVNGSAAVSLKLPTTISANFKGGTISGTTGTFSSSLSVTGDIAASSNVNVTNQTKSKTFNIDGGCTLEYDSTNKCVKFVF